VRVAACAQKARGRRNAAFAFRKGIKRKKSKQILMTRRRLGQRGQTSTEYMLLIALGLTVVIISISIATQMKDMTDTLLVRAQIERDATISMIVR